MEQCPLGLLGLLALLGLLGLSHSTFSPLLSLTVLIVLTPTEGHFDTPLNIHIVADTPEGLNLDNRWSVSAAERHHRMSHRC